MDSQETRKGICTVTTTVATILSLLTAAKLFLV